jgi:alkaline phosphatase D
MIMRKILVLSILIAVSAFGNSNTEKLKAIRHLDKIIFGSCNNQHDSQPLWKHMIDERADLFIWGGDNVYAETTDPAKIRKAYDIQNRHPDYRYFKDLTPIIGLWDDHDFAFDNARGNFKFKKESQQHLLDFLEEPLNSQRRMKEGIYTTYSFGEGDQSVKIILLDNRYFKDLDPHVPLLGQKQWEWLEKEMMESQASLHIIASGLSIFSPKLPVTDEWADYPSEQKRLMDLLKRTKLKAPLFISGDKHFSSIFMNKGFLEFMSSGMTHSVPSSMRAFLKKSYPFSYFGLSFGQIEVEWMKNNPMIKLIIKNSLGKSEISKSFLWDGLIWKEK